MFELRVTSTLKFDEAKKRVEQGVQARLMKCGYLVEAEMKRLLSTGGGERHTPSASGDPPHLQTGNLRSSIQTARTQDGHVIVGPTTTAWYGKVHEYGGRHHPARPFARRALSNTADKFPEHFGRLDLSGGEKAND